MIIIIGLGNPTEEYANTYHNMGFMVLDKLAEIFKKDINKRECNSLVASFSVRGEKVVLAKPQTFMNLSGESVKCLLKRYNADVSEIVVVFDDIDIEKYTVRARLNGSAGTHNGMKNIIEHIQSQNFKRIRVGIGKNNQVLRDFVLSEIKADEKEKFDESIEKLAKILQQYIYRKDFNMLMRETNKIGKTEIVDKAEEDKE
ncbi:MAG TPA: aminoacyl-tRNA hydrolase [Clostridia bacterium]|jgi:PTH1 family peptidyl-tRNA hydrolase|nr:aminoacyl-tRNA hydrolase [Clostridia bacterium]